MPARVGVVGAGWWATVVHLPALRENPDCELVGVCDVNAARAQRAADTFAVPHVVHDVSDLLALSLDAVLVATHHDDHYAPAAAALDAGVDVCVEKPLTVTSSQAWDLVARARLSGANLHVGYTFPHSRPAQALREAIATGDLGDLVMATSLFATSIAHLYNDPSSPYADPESGGQLLTQLTHAVSLVLWLTGLEVESVAARAHPRGTADPDVTVAVAVQFINGAVGTFASTGLLSDQERRIEEYRFFGTGGHATLDTHAGHLRVLRNDHPATDFLATPPSEANPLAAPARALVATALGQAPVVVPGELGARTVDVLQAARTSMRTGEPVTVTPKGSVDV